MLFIKGKIGGCEQISQFYTHLKLYVVVLVKVDRNVKYLIDCF